MFKALLIQVKVDVWLLGTFSHPWQYPVVCSPYHPLSTHFELFHEMASSSDFIICQLFLKKLHTRFLFFVWNNKATFQLVIFVLH